ncbi:MAG: nitroreductase family protein [Hyphomicrobiales bacterium]|nr:MAG: nitroreductase family protein [Hyphomicrobiales bacterium]
MKVSEAIASRISCRAFLPDPIPEKTVREILDRARRAPSGGNLQPWHCHAVTGPALKALLADVRAQMELTPRGEPGEFRVYPEGLSGPYEARRFKCGEDLYRTIGVARDDKPGRVRQFRRNFELFGAPVALFIYIDRRMGPPQWADIGMFLQNIFLLAREQGLHSCPQEAWAQWHGLIAAHLKPPAEHMLFCGVALGRMDESAPVNSLRTDRAGLDEIARFHGFG